MHDPLCIEIAVDTALLEKAIEQAKRKCVVAVKNTTRKPIPPGATLTVQLVKNRWRIVAVDLAGAAGEPR